MKRPTRTRTGLAALSFVAGLSCSLTAIAQDRARDLEPDMARLMAEVRKQDAGATIQGAQGFLNFAQAFPETNDLSVLPPLFASVSAVEEPVEALHAYQSRGVRVAFDFATLDKLVPDQEARVAMSLLDGESVELVFVKSEYRSPTRYTWFGQIAGIAVSDFILVRYDDTIFLTVCDYQNKRNFEVQYMPGIGATPAGHTLAKQGDILPQHQCGTCQGGCGHQAPLQEPLDQPGDNPQGPGGGYGERSDPSDPAHVIDVLVVCTAGAQAGYGYNPGAFFAQTEACIADMNLRHSTSFTGATMRLTMADWDAAGGYNEDGNGSVDLARLVDHDQFLENMFGLRDLCRADVVAMIRQNQWQVAEGVAVGVARRPETLAEVQAGGKGFSVNARAGGLPLVGDVFSHELGHNLGACHDQAQQPQCAAPTGSPHGKVIDCDRFFCYDYWHTTMAYGPGGGCSASTLLPLWSNPAITYVTPAGCPNRVIGDAVCNVSGLISLSKNYASQARIAASQSWTYAPSGNGGNGTRYSPFGYVRTAVAQVQGGESIARVRMLGGTYEETSSNGGPVVLSNPCLVQSADGGASIIR
ncbi:MAG: zinc-dependent metalloprotease family protein [Phycisphaerales bacterium]